MQSKKLHVPLTQLKYVHVEIRDIIFTGELQIQTLVT
jgi:hypothetical protein